MKKLFKEFQEFALGSSVFELAIGVIIGGAVGNMVSTLVSAILMPIIGIFMGGKDFSSLSYVVGSAEIQYGLFLQSVIDFLIIAICIFLIAKGINSLKEKMLVTEAKEVKPEEKQPTAEDYLKEIRDILETKNAQ